MQSEHNKIIDGIKSRIKKVKQDKDDKINELTLQLKSTNQTTESLALQLQNGLTKMFLQYKLFHSLC